MASLFGLHAIATYRASDRLRPGRADLVRRSKSPGEIWRDRFLDLIRKLQPATLVNDRIGLPGDYQTPEQFITEHLTGCPLSDVWYQRHRKRDITLGFSVWETVPGSDSLPVNQCDHSRA